MYRNSRVVFAKLTYFNVSIANSYRKLDNLAVDLDDLDAELILTYSLSPDVLSPLAREKIEIWGSMFGDLQVAYGTLNVGQVLAQHGIPRAGYYAMDTYNERQRLYPALLSYK